MLSTREEREKDSLAFDPMGWYGDPPGRGQNGAEFDFLQHGRDRRSVQGARGPAHEAGRLSDLGGWHQRHQAQGENQRALLHQLFIKDNGTAQGEPAYEVTHLDDPNDFVFNDYDNVIVA